MHRACFLVCAKLLTLLAACSPVPEPTRLRVVTWNVENLFNDRRDSPEVLTETVAAGAEYRARVAAIQAELRRLAPDVVALQEVENAAVAEDLARGLPGFAHVRVSRGNDPRGIDNAVLSRFPITSVRSHAAESFPTASGQNVRFARDCHEVHLDVGGLPLVVLVVHLKATASAASAERREAEARRTRDIAAGLAAPWLVLGDFNAEPGDAELVPLEDTWSLAQALPPGRRASHASGRQLDDQRLGPAPGLAPVPGSAHLEFSATVTAISDHFPLSGDYLRSP